MSNNNIDITQPRLTAYALGELDERDRRAMEAYVATDPHAQREVEDVRAVARLLTNELSKETSAVTPEGRQSPRPIAAVMKRRVSLWAVAGVGVAASVIIGLATVAYFTPSLRPGRYAQTDGAGNAQADFSTARQPAVAPAAPTAAPSDSKNEAGRSSAGNRQPVWRNLDTAPSASAGPGVGYPGMGYPGGGYPGYLGARLGMPGMMPGMMQPGMAAPGAGGFGYVPDGGTPGSNTESYSPIADNGFVRVADQPLSTFSIDVDTASYSNVRRYLNSGALPPKDAVRIEEMVNYFPYRYAPPKEGDAAPFAAQIEVAGCPWNKGHRLVRVGLKGREIARDKRPPSNLVFLIDVSGSMQPENKLPLVKQGLRMLVRELKENDRVAIVVYAGETGLLLPDTTGDQRATILRAIDALGAGGSTNGAGGITLAYQVASEHFIKGGVNRVLLCTDGDFNVGVTDPQALTKLIEEKATTGVFLSVLGFGMGNLKDATMEKLADKGTGNYAYVDNLAEARKVLVEQMSGTLVTIAKDVKTQVEFNPAKVSGYRLVGYENRLLAKEDFSDDRKDAGEIGAGHTVTALYEVVPAGAAAGADRPGVDELKYQKPAAAAPPPGPAAGDASAELLTVKLRYKEPDGTTSRLLEFPVTDGGVAYAKASDDFKFAASVAAFGMILRDSPHKGQVTFDGVLELAQEGKGADASGYRGEFIELVRAAKALPR